ncbi:MAG: DMT family transporter [candidate division Zixibacteria bacterium]|nr:DMT family transporter [candidate division Zixibacteria bacterium]
MTYLGELAALGTAFFWAFTAIFFSKASKRAGAFNVNKVRLLMAVVIYAIVLLILKGSLFHQDLNSSQLFWLGLSGFIGLVLGDLCIFKALVIIGPRLTTLIFSTTPIMTTIIAWVFLGEKLGLLDVLGISVTVAGVSWIVSEGRSDNQEKPEFSKKHPDSGSYQKGVILALGASLGQALGLVLAKQGMTNAGSDLDPMLASFVRMLFATVIIWLISAFRGKLNEVALIFKDKVTFNLTLSGSICGPFLGVWLSLLALNYISTGVAATLNATVPIMIIPIMFILYQEKTSVRALAGAVIAVAGVALLFIT